MPPHTTDSHQPCSSGQPSGNIGRERISKGTTELTPCPVGSYPAPVPADAENAQEQVAWLAHDADLVLKTLEGQLAKTPPTADTDDAAQFLAVTGDLWRIVIQHCNATAYLLHEDIAEPAAVVYRAAYETMVTLNYILNRPTRDEQVEAALLHFAYSRLEIAKWFAGHPSAVDAERILNIMPPAVVREGS